MFIVFMFDIKIFNNIVKQVWFGAMEQRFFYHSFPRWASTPQEAVTKGLRVLNSIVNSGLLLTPEKIEWSEFLQDGTRSKPIQVFQKRISFTELSPRELPEHARTFGPYALEFTVENLRLLGGIPVFYLPQPGPQERALEGVAAAIVARLADIQTVLARLADLAGLVTTTADKAELIQVIRNGIPIGVTRCSIQAAEDLLQILRFEVQPPQDLLNTIRALSGFFYPTEDLTYTGVLAYYRQREWRIVANMSRRGVEVTRDLSFNEMERLCELDPEFYGRRLTFPTGEHRRVDQCKYLSDIENRPLWMWVRRVIAPDEAVAEVQALLESLGCFLSVMALSNLAISNDA